MTADFYHQLTRMGGCRPLGCTAMLLGVDESFTSLFRTDPGGGLEECRFAAAGSSQDTMGRELVAFVASLDEKSDSNEKDSDADKSMADRVLRLLDKSGKSRKGKTIEGSTLDVWTIQPMKHRRGGMLATCYSDVCKDNLNEILL